MTERATVPEAIDPDRNTWLARIAAPLEDSPCGRDPKDTDEFFLLRQEIEKRRENQYDRIQTVCREMLSHTAKDLRVAGYLIMASVYVRGLVGLAEAIRAYRLIVEAFWEDCHPRKPNARRLTVEWLNNAKLTALVRAHAVDGNPDLVASIAEDTATINACLAAWFESEPPSWTALNEWLAERARLQPATDTSTGPTASHPSSENAGGTISSDRAMLAATRNIRAYLLDRNEPLQAAAYARALRWSRLRLPNTGADGCTPIAPPRASALADIRTAIAEKRWADVVNHCEEVFMEPGGQFLLDLQRWAVEAACADGQSDLEAFITGQTGLLVQRLPDLPRQRFEGGLPFADMATRRWVDRQNAALSASPPAENPTSKGRADLAHAEEAAARAVQQHGLSQGLAILNQIPTSPGHPDAARTLAMARLCMAAHRPDLAAPMLDALADTATKTHLALWDPPLAIAIWHALIDALEAAATEDRRTDTDRSERIIDLKHYICRTDPEAASRIF